MLEKPVASQKQKAMFFALSHELGFEADEVKKRAKERFNLTSLKDITKEQCNWLIDRLLEKQTSKK